MIRSNGRLVDYSNKMKSIRGSLRSRSRPATNVPSKTLLTSTINSRRSNIT